VAARADPTSASALRVNHVGMARTSRRCPSSSISPDRTRSWWHRSPDAQGRLDDDSLRSCDVVTADDEYLVVDEDHHPELFWGLRGGGSNFGIVTSFEFDLHPVGPIMYSGCWISLVPSKIVWLTTRCSR
jgi:hypothetical protein